MAEGKKKGGENEAKATTTAEFARVSLLVFPSRQTNRQQRRLAFPISRLGVGGGEKKKKSFFFFLAFRPRSQASLACSSIFKKKKRKRLCAGHGCSNAPIVSTVNPLLSPHPPPPQDSFFSDSFEGRLNREGGLIYLEKKVVSVLYKEPEYKAEKPKY